MLSTSDKPLVVYMKKGKVDRSKVKMAISVIRVEKYTQKVV